MNITVQMIKENNDGSADATVNFDKEGLEMLVQEGLLSLLRQALEMDKNARDGVKLRKKMEKKDGNKKSTRGKSDTPNKNVKITA
jgi:hypothetical protein